MAFASALIAAILLETQDVFGSGKLSTVLEKLGGIGLPFYAIAAELTKSYAIGRFVWFSADWLIYSLMCLICLSFVRALQGRA